jgi:2-alkyl-3-oxoalkanoate reductase
MPILLTGASGFLGTKLVAHLCSSGETHLRCFVRPNSDTSKLDGLRAKYPSTRFEYVVGNLLSRDDAYRATHNVDMVYHLAAQMRGAAPSLYENAVVASRNLLEGVIAHRVRRVVLVSSISVYGLSHLRRRVVITETQPLDPHPEQRDCYTFAKVRQDLLFQEYRRQNDFELIVLRPGAIYGESRHLLPSRAALRLGPVLLQIAAHNPIPVVYVDNCVAALALAGSQTFPEGCYNVVDDNLPTGQEYVQAFRSVADNVHCMKLSVPLAILLSHLLDRYRSYSKGRIPRLLTPYQVRATWGGHTFSNHKLKGAGWRPLVSTSDAMLCTFKGSKSEIQLAAAKESGRTYIAGHPSRLVKSEN